MRIALYMDQGVVADLTQHYLYSQQFSSCAPVVLFNDKTNMGGLYHVPGGFLGQNARRNLQTMGSIIKPTDVYIFHGRGQHLDSEYMENKGTEPPKMTVTTDHVPGVRLIFDKIAKVHIGDGSHQDVACIGACATENGKIHFDYVQTLSLDLRLNKLDDIKRLPSGCRFFGEQNENKLSIWK